MMMRIIKIFVSFVILLFYWILDKNHIRNFAVIFIIFYVINLLWETNIYLWMENISNTKKIRKSLPANGSINEKGMHKFFSYCVLTVIGLFTISFRDMLQAIPRYRRSST